MPAWSENTSTKAWTRDITGIDGGLVAIEKQGASAELQLENLHGDIIATASSSETSTALLSKADTSEFGVPTISNPEKYAWLGAMGLPTELPSGVVVMGVRSYVPQLGRFLQPDPIPGGSANAYCYTFDDPVNTVDPTGEYSATGSEGILNALSNEAEATVALREAIAEVAARAIAENAALQAEWAAEATAGPQYANGEEEWEEWEEEEGYEYSSYTPEQPDHERGTIKSGVFYELPWSEGSASGKDGRVGAAATCNAATGVTRDYSRYSDIAQC